jgi:hypothetical protein
MTVRLRWGRIWSGCPYRRRTALHVYGLWQMAAQRGSPGSPLGLKDFQILDPAGYYLRITERA